MGYTHLLVAVSASPESHALVAKAVSIARPFHSRLTLITLTSDPEMYNQLAAPMMENVREMLQEETQQFMNDLVSRADYPIEQVIITSGELSEHVLHTCRTQGVDLVICGNHNQSFFARAACSAKAIVGSCKVDVLLVPLSE
ncbi:universal stress protein UspC [Phytobacter diazotrophicus]|uniref:universal stress protein UspC n=1 Tax=Phytobacter diazotrophicus TaxID=395631 RepID=UPI00232BE294|nr:universal stress protein UspC [Phytobacter diazotrophicus]MDC0727548.1 universal stress protein UspC [Phytobacter diazotrophicus]MDC0734898.1 universal stress protein UspC [Phytobacter diazotrophicus]